MDKLTQEFVTESLEGLDRMERCLTELEARPSDAGLIGEIFRVVHTIKGITGFLGFGRLERLTHSGESLMSAVRGGRVKATTEVVSALLKMMDRAREIVRTIEILLNEGEVKADDDFELRMLLDRLSEGAMSGERPVAKVNAEVVSGWSGSNEKTLRVDVEVLNRMMGLVGDLVLTRNQMLQSQLDSKPNSGDMAELLRRLGGVTAELREAVMEGRMQPVAHLFGKFPRMVRDLALSCGKELRLELAGQETGLDKSLLEAIKGPLLHALRNAVDHGIETAEVRLAAGKPRQGRIRLGACQRNGWVVVEMSDDGAGISAERVLAKAIERGVVTAKQASAMSESEARQLIFLPGFSTAEQVTHISGRGVGMDVVRDNVERAGGLVEIESQEGVGTTLRLRLPLTLAIVPALVLRSGEQSFCVPQAGVAECRYLDAVAARAAIEVRDGKEFYRQHEAVIPLVWLDKLVDVRRAGTRTDCESLYVAVLEMDGCRFGLAVDELLDAEEILVKPLSDGLRQVGLFSGVTELGNGCEAMILDVEAVAARSGFETEASAGCRGCAAMGEKEPAHVAWAAGVDRVRTVTKAVAPDALERIFKGMEARIRSVQARAEMRLRRGA